MLEILVRVTESLLRQIDSGLELTDLDELFGKAREPVRSLVGSQWRRLYGFEEWEKKFSPLTLSNLNQSGSQISQLISHDLSNDYYTRICFQATILFTVSQQGEVLTCLEEVVDWPAGRREEGPLVLYNRHNQKSDFKLGHPSMVKCGKGRISGELVLREFEDSYQWELNNKSGRYGRVPGRKRENLVNVAKELEKYGINTRITFYD